MDAAIVRCTVCALPFINLVISPDCSEKDFTNATNESCWLAVRREEKIKRAMRQQKHASAASETASDRSRTDRDSAEVNPAASFSLPLAAAPERGILKKGSSRGSISDITTKSAKSSWPLRATASSGDDAAPAADDDADNRQQLLLPTAEAAVSGVGDSDGFEFIDGVDDDGSCCSCSCDEDESINDDNGTPDDAATSPETAACVGAGGCSVETQTDPESLSSSMTSVFDPAEKMTRLCNINELLRQIDEQFNSVLRGAASMTLPDVAADDLSPTNSDDVRGSETEADRACTQFFPQSGHTSDSVTNIQPGTSSNDTKLEAAAIDRVVKPPCGPVIRPGALAPHRTTPSPSSDVGETSDATMGPRNIRAPALVPYRGLASAASTDRLLSRLAAPIPLGASSSPATVTSEGYHSDRMPPAEAELPVIIREIPKSSTMPVQILSDSNVSRPQSKNLNSPDDVNV